MSRTSQLGKTAPTIRRQRWLGGGVVRHPAPNRRFATVICMAFTYALGLSAEFTRRDRDASQLSLP